MSTETTRLITTTYLEQVMVLPKTGRHILAQYDDNSIVVYQAYNPEIGHYAAEHQHFGGEFSLTRMSWIKTNFLWMMFRSGWGTKPNQEVILAVRIKRSAFDSILPVAVHASFAPEVYADQAAWKTALSQSPVRVQWDPDHHPTGTKLERRAIQLGLSGAALASYAREWIVDIEDISEFARKQRLNSRTRAYDKLIIPKEQIYPVQDAGVAARLGISTSRAKG